MSLVLHDQAFLFCNYSLSASRLPLVIASFSIKLVFKTHIVNCLVFPKFFPDPHHTFAWLLWSLLLLMSFMIKRLALNFEIEVLNACKDQLIHFIVGVIFIFEKFLSLIKSLFYHRRIFQTLDYRDQLDYQYSGYWVHYLCDSPTPGNEPLVLIMMDKKSLGCLVWGKESQDLISLYKGCEPSSAWYTRCFWCFVFLTFFMYVWIIFLFLNFLSWILGTFFSNLSSFLVFVHMAKI